MFGQLSWPHSGNCHPALKAIYCELLLLDGLVAVERDLHSSVGLFVRGVVLFGFVRLTSLPSDG